MSRHRRRFLQGVGATGIAGVLAGCLGGDDEPENGDGGNDDDEPENGDDPEPASFEVNNLDPEEATVTRGGSVDVSATIENTGDEEGTEEVDLLVDGDDVDSTELTLDGGEGEEVSFSLEGVELDAGEYEHAIATDDDEASGTLTVEALVGDDPDPLLSFEEDPVRLITESTSLSGTLENSYGVAVEDGAVGLEAPEGWEVTDEEGTSFDIDAGESQDVSWGLEIPEGAEGEYELEFAVNYSALGESAETSTSQNAVVVEPISAPFGIDAGGELYEESVEIDGLEFHPTTEQRAEIDSDNVDLEEDAWWPDAVAFDPLPNVAINEEGEDIEGTEHDSLYWTEYWQNNAFSIDLAIENGIYEVTFHWAEVVFDEEEERVFSAYVNDQPVIEDLDLTADVGFATATTAATAVNVTDNRLSIDLESSVENPKLSGVEIREADLDTGLVGKYDATSLDFEDGSAVAAWPDESGAGLELTQDEEGAQPTFHADGDDGNPTVRFEGDADFGEGDFINSEGVPTDDTEGVTLAAAFNTHDVTAERQTVVYNGNDDNGDGYGIFVNNEGGSGPDSEGYVHALYGGVNWYWSDTQVEEDQFHVVTLTIPQNAPDEPELRLDGQLLQLEDQAAANPPAAPSDQFSIGQDMNDGHAPPYFHGDVGEVLVYDRELTDSEREELENQLGDRWGADVEHQIEGLAAHWTFDEEGVDGDTVIDRSGNGHDGELVGDVETGLEAPIGQGAAFAGDDDDPELVLVEDDDALDSPEFTVSAWIRTDADAEGAWPVLVGKEGSMWCGIEGEDGENLRLDPYDGMGHGPGEQPWSETVVTDGEWYHVVYRHAPSEGVSEIYVDGDVDSSVEPQGDSPGSDQPLGIAANPDTDDWRDWFVGELADVRLYDEPLSEDEIAALYQAGD